MLLTHTFLMYTPLLLLNLYTKVNAWDDGYQYPWTTATTNSSSEHECDKFKSSCKVNTQHTMCKYTGIGRACKNVGEGGVTDEEKNEIVDTHNNLRAYVAAGNETRGDPGPQPAATNMLKMSWDEDLARVAQRWADQCTFAHDACRNDHRGAVGQNIFLRYEFPRHPINWTRAITAWYDEVAMFNRSFVPNYSFDSRTGHYTQVVWAKTFLVGCGRRDYGEYTGSSSSRTTPGKKFQPKKIYVCNYFPAGNWLGEPIYDTNGTTCEHCPNGTTCRDSLCEFTFPPSNNTSPTSVLYSTSKTTPKQISMQSTARLKGTTSKEPKSRKRNTNALHASDHMKTTTMEETTDATHSSTSRTSRTATTTTTYTSGTDDTTSTTEDTTAESLYDYLLKLLALYGISAVRVVYYY